MRRRLVLAALVTALLPSPVAAQDVIEYYGVDALGSVRVVFDASGNLINRMDYGPFGEQLAGSGFSRRVYAQLFRDGETGQDYAEARMYASRTGRLTAPDPLFASSSNSQRWNRYAYVGNNPLSLVDPTGLIAEGPEPAPPPIPPRWPTPEPPDGCTPFPTLDECEEPGPQPSPGPGPTPPPNPNPPNPNPNPPPPPVPPPPPPPQPPVPKPTPRDKVDCTRSGWQTLLPDYWHIQINFPIPTPWTGNAAGVTISVGSDRFSNWYGGMGPNAARAMLPSGSITAGWIQGDDSQVRTRSFLSGWSGSYGSGNGLYAGGVYSPSAGIHAFELGLATPQIGVSATHNWIGEGASPCR